MLDTAIRYIKLSIGLEEENLVELQHDYQLLGDAQYLAGQYKDAADSKDRSFALTDSINAMDIRIKIEQQEAKRELELKDKQIVIDKLEVAKKRNERALFIAGIILLLTVVVIVIRNMRLAAARELSENKLNAFQARMNPHFIFNSLSSIQYLVLNNENERSADYLSEFSTLMRQILDTSAKNKVSLKTEIEMLRSYIELENLRFECFKWEITTVGDLTTDYLEVPGMIIQPFVENAILHGLIPKEEGGELHITFERTGRHIVCTVDDNGIGRERSYELNRKKNKEHQSHGIDIATNRLLLLNNKKKGLVNTVTYTDKQDGGKPTGTTVIVKLPIL
jgi:LytS/YehU family sensor histidine kinase